MAVKPLGQTWAPRIRALFAGLAAEAELEPPLLSRLCAFLDVVAEWNQRTDLTAARNDDEFVDLFLADAVLLARTTPRDSTAEWLDVGAGAGAPGLALALLRPSLRLLLVEPRQKRVAFLRTAVGQLGCEQVRVLRARSDALANACCDVAVSRATFSPEEWLREGARLARTAVWVLLAKSAPPALTGWRADQDCEYRWPLTRVERRALRFGPSREPSV